MCALSITPTERYQGHSRGPHQVVVVLLSVLSGRIQRTNGQEPLTFLHNLGPWVAGERDEAIGTVDDRVRGYLSVSQNEIGICSPEGGGRGRGRQPISHRE